LCFANFRAGELIEVRSGIAEIGERRSASFTGSSIPKPARVASMEGVLTFDVNTRKALTPRSSTRAGGEAVSGLKV
jgi:hypothetical protein